ncbi:hypothetical protein [Rhodonellum sp.]|uniref:hypothetical protein n=1 Tax=Rhodonellum sp. TaxID=2231180 RepID=UPI0027184945|nr:hypothetical protein [Rhodonellum sp.]MDO9553665.1 hypothetical protein [Rhodonellum sp.]
MRFFLIPLFSVIFSFSAFSQVNTTSEYDKDGNVLIYAENPDVIPYSLKIEFKSLTNLIPSSGMASFAVASPGRSQVAKLRKQDPNQSTTVKFATTIYKGNFLAKNKEEIPSLLPVDKGVEVTVYNMTHLENSLKFEKTNESYVGISIHFESPTLICTPRKGVVSQIKEDEELKGTSYTFSALDNFIELYHEDGTFTKLVVLKAGSVKVKIGETVFPGDVLAESSGEKYESGRHVRMIQTRLEKNNEGLTMKTIQTKFYDESLGSIVPETGTKITAVHPGAMVTKEMSKKELKKHQESN